MSRLDDFIRKNRPAFDDSEPAPDLWQRIEQELQPAPAVRRLWPGRPAVRVAAAALIVLAGYGVFELGRRSGRSEAGGPAPLAQLNPELAQAEVYYTSLINQEKALLNPQEMARLGLNDDFNQDLGTLDSAYGALKKQLLAEPNKEPIVAAMIQNLQLRVEVIRQQIETLQRVSQYRRKNLPSKAI